MTDNRATELLREGLTEHGIEWRNGLEGVTFVGDWCFVEYDNGKLAATCEPVLTPEQAIAATLGRPKAKSHPYGYERDTGAYDCTRCECGCINDISATYCNDCGGEIEIDESAEKEYYDGYSKHTVFAKKHDDGSIEFCERRYVPEYAATLGSEREKALEDLVRDMWFWGYEGHMDSESQDWQMKHIDGVLDRMKELGIGVIINER